MYCCSSDGSDMKRWVPCCRVCPVPGPTGPTGPTGASGQTGPDPYDLYVQADAAPDGDGTRPKPFQTLGQALAEVQPNGTLHVLCGIYPVTQQFTIF